MKLFLALCPTVFLVLYGQLITKWRVGVLANAASTIPSGQLSKLINYLSDPYIISAYVASLLGSVAWMFVIERYPLSIAFPIYISGTILGVIVGGVIIFNEPLTPLRISALLLIISGVILGSLP